MKKTSMIRYTVEQLEALKESPLVRQPDKLPQIEQWMETAADQNNRKTRQASGTEAENQRPNLINTRKVRTSFGYDDDPVYLEPPKFAFTFSTTVRSSKPTDSTNKPSASQDSDNTNGERIGQRERFFKDRENDRGRDRPGPANGRRGQREEGEGWTNVRNRKGLENDEHDRFQKPVGKDREKNDGEDQPLRRTGVGRGRFEQPWGREDTTAAKDVDTGKFTNTRVSGWREREKERDRKDDRDWNKGARLDDDPEWMGVDAPVSTEKKQGRTQEDFQRWMKEMKSKTAGRDETTNPELETLTDSSKPKQETSTSAAGSSIPPTPLNLESTGENFFGIWGEPKRTDPKTAEATTTAKTGPSKPKPSRFASLFTPQEETKPPQDPPENIVPASPEPSGSSEDREGFQRILQMLGGTNISNQAPPPSGLFSTANVAKHTPAAELPHPNYPLDLEQPTARHAGGRSKDRAAILEAILPKNTQSPFGLSSPSNNSAWDAPSTSSKNDFQDEYMHQPPSRNGGIADVGGLHSYQSRPLSQTEARKREFLLNLIQPPQHTPSQTSNHDSTNYHLDMNNRPMSYGERGQNLQMPKARGPPQSGFLDFPDQDMLRRPAEINHQPDQNRKPAPRQPPGLYDEPSMSANVPRRNTNDNPPRLTMGNMGIPQHQDTNWMKYQGMHTPQDRVPPPPGFPGRVPQPQGPPNYGGPQPMQFPGNINPHPIVLQRGVPGVPPHFQGQPQMGPPGYYGGSGGPGGPGGPNGPPPPGFPPMGLQQDMIPPQRRPVGPGPGPGPGGYDLFNEMQLRGRGGPPNHFM